MSTSDLILAVDGGGTKTCASLTDAIGIPLGEAVGGPCNLYSDPAGGLAEIRRLWEILAAELGLDPAAAARRTTLSAGLAGANAPGSLERFEAAFATFARAHLSTDGYTTLLGATGGKPGALLAIGTGVVGYRLHGDGRVVQKSGWGFPVGDRGSGAWLGLEALARWLETLDDYGSDAESRLWPALETKLEGRTPAAILGWLKTARPTDFASLAPLVVTAAAAGDAAATAVVDQAAEHHLRLANALEPTEAEPLVLGGGLASVFRPKLEAALGPALAEPGRTASPLDGARLVAIGRSPAQFKRS